jgi:hypothetical protein
MRYSSVCAGGWLRSATKPDASCSTCSTRFALTPIYDNVTLGFADRERIVRGGPKVPVPQSVNVRTFLVDGFTAGYWKIVAVKERATLMIEPFGRLAKADRAALTEEGLRLLAFAAPEAARREVRTRPAR